MLGELAAYLSRLALDSAMKRKPVLNVSVEELISSHVSELRMSVRHARLWRSRSGYPEPVAEADEERKCESATIKIARSDCVSCNGVY